MPFTSPCRAFLLVGIEKGITGAVEDLCETFAASAVLEVMVQAAFNAVERFSLRENDAQLSPQLGMTAEFASHK